MTEPVQRIPRITETERTDAVRAMFDAIAGVGPANIEHHPVLMTFAQHPALTHPFLDFNNHILSTNTLPVRLRQIVILRTCWHTRAVYAWTSHLQMSLRLGLEEEVFAAAKQGPASPYWSPAERTVLTATDQVLANYDIDDAGWEELSGVLDRKQIMDLLFTVGTYAMLAMVKNTIRVQRMPDLLELADRYGAPEYPAP
jgi:alkylhydroperoxidase family enzyme